MRRVEPKIFGRTDFLTWLQARVSTEMKKARLRTKKGERDTAHDVRQRDTAHDVGEYDTAQDVGERL